MGCHGSKSPLPEGWFRLRSKSHPTCVINVGSVQLQGAEEHIPERFKGTCAGCIVGVDEVENAPNSTFRVVPSKGGYVRLALRGYPDLTLNVVLGGHKGAGLTVWMDRHPNSSFCAVSEPQGEPYFRLRPQHANECCIAIDGAGPGASLVLCEMSGSGDSSLFFVDVDSVEANIALLCSDARLQAIENSHNGDFIEMMIQRQHRIRQERGYAVGTHQVDEVPTTHAYVADIKSISDRDLLTHWTKQHIPLPEYQEAADTICVEHVWMRTTMLLQHVDDISRVHRSELEAIKSNPESWHETLEHVISRAYGLAESRKARSQKDVVSGARIFQKVDQVYKSLEPWKQPLFVLAWQVMVDCEPDATAIVTKLSEVVDRALHCRQVQVRSFQLVLSHSSHLVAARLAKKREDNSKSENEQANQEGHQEEGDRDDVDVMPGEGCEEGRGGDEFNVALRRFYECFLDFLDDHKERAFSASFMEPARFYWAHSGVGPGFLQDNVDTHAINWHLSLLNAALGVHVPRMPTYWDDFPPPVGDFWAGLKDEAWEQFFSQPNHFGNSWQGIPGLDRRGKELIERKVRSGFLPDYGQEAQTGTELGASYNQAVRVAKCFANDAVDPNGDVANRLLLALYLNRFAAFFARDFFVRKAFEAMNSESKPEHAGFRRACETLFEAYRAEHPESVQADTYVEHCYLDDMYMELGVDRVAHFFAWLGVVKP